MKLVRLYLLTLKGFALWLKSNGKVLSLYSLLMLLISWQNLLSQEHLVCSHESGFYTGNISVKIDSDFDSLYYTLDGSFPYSKSKLYKDSIAIWKTTVLTIRPFHDGQFSDTTFTQSYFVDFNTNLAVTSLATEPMHLWDPTIGIYVSGIAAKDTFPYDGANYWRDWEYPALVQHFTADKELALNQPAGVKLFGGMSRNHTEKSLRLLSRKEYAKKNFKYKIFKDKKIKKFKSLVLRTSGNDHHSTRFRDALSGKLAGAIGLDFQAYEPTHLFMNGEYWGVFNLREKINEEFLQDNYKLDSTNLDLLQGNAYLEHGSDSTFNQLRNLFKKLDFRKDSRVEVVEKLMDVRNYFNYRILQIYLANEDESGNTRFWRSDQLDGKFRWILYDTDLGFGWTRPYGYNYLHDCLSPEQTEWYNPEWSTLFLRKLLINKKKKNEFITQTCHLLNTALHQDSVVAKIDEFENLLSGEIDQHLKRQKIRPIVWKISVEKIRTFARKRPKYLIKHLKKEFGLDGMFHVGIKVNPPEAGHVLIQGNPVKDGFTGKYFKNIPIEYSSKANRHYRFEGWGNHPLRVLDIANGSDSLFLTANFSKITGDSDYQKKVWVNEISGLNKVEGAPGDWIELYNNSKSKICLAGWEIEDLNSFVKIEDSIWIAPKQYLVLSLKNPKIQLTNSHPVLPFGIHSVIETIKIYDNNSLLVDSISYDLTERLANIDTAYTYQRIWNDPSSNYSNWELQLGMGSPGLRSSDDKANQLAFSENEHLSHEELFEKMLWTLVLTFLLILIFYASFFYIIFKNKWRFKKNGRSLNWKPFHSSNDSDWSKSEDF